VSESQIEGYAFGACRDLRHRWGRSPVLRTDQGGRVLLRVAVCDDCGTLRTERFRVNARGHVTMALGARYDYPSGYRLKGRVPASSFRMASLEAALQAGVEPLEETA
jgi:hypothetical protein